MVDVLVVDDNATARALLAELVGEVAGVQVAGEAASGDEGLQRAREHPFDVVVMDWSMPDMDGIEATRRLRAAHPGIRVVGWTSTDDPGLHRVFTAAGAEAVFIKERVVPLLRFLSRAAAAAPA
jgi:CheY-like chemotaxis protein